MSEANIQIAVPRASRKSFKPKRLLKENTLLRNQIKHFYQLEKDIRAKLRAGIQYRDVKTEADAAAYIGKLTGILHPHLVSAGYGSAGGSGGAATAPARAARK